MDFKAIFEQERLIAEKLTEKTYNGTPGTGYQYYKAEEGKEYSNRGVCLAFLAVEYDEFESWFLAGPFIEQDKHYGLLSIYQINGLKPLQVYIDEMRKSQLKGNSTTYMPYSARKRLEDYVGDCTFYWDDITKQSFSSFDLMYGEKEIPSEILCRLTESGKTQVFFNTNGATAKVLELLTSSEVGEWGESLKRSADRIEEEMRKTQVCAEKPFYVHLTGNDDCSWGVALASEQEVLDTVEAVYDRENVAKLMHFTN